ncbi:MAG TPA: 2-succinyl-6-hydroxy-2,4-cyclohexadiene-1-carboxylate synthase [Ignavibacteriales bacterium]|nr:2-succinyl-6-hydroxy-2,4-cyclohexadiene-1-carboxylate synthase [Ignavibacteriales bacterium]
MLIKINDDININVEVPERSFTATSIPVIFLHGFSGSSRDWLQFFPSIDSNFAPFAIDLIGHGKSSSPKGPSYYTAESNNKHILEVLNILTISEAVFAGYSMGGRAALSFAAAHPGKVKGLFLESSSPGISDPNLKAERIASDNKLAEFIIKNGIEAFVDYWEEIPTFQSQKSLPKYLLLEQRRKRLDNNITGLSNSLQGFGTGTMPDLWGALPSFTFPGQLVTGSLDEKFTSINNKMASMLKHARHYAVQSAGHNVHLERPKLFLNLLNNFLTQFPNR